MEINMTQPPSYDELEIERPRICGGTLFLKLVKSGRWMRLNPSLQKRQQKNQDPLLTSSSSHSSSLVSRGLNSSSPARSYTSKSSNISDRSESDKRSLSTIPINMYDPSKTQYCMPRQIMGTRTTSSKEHKDCSKLDFKLHEELNSDIFLTKEDPDNFPTKLEGKELYVEEHVSSQSIIQFDPHLINDLKTKHLQSIGEKANYAENQINMEQDVAENTENRSVNRLQTHFEQKKSALSEVLSELEQADDVDENKDVDATWSSLQRVRITQKTNQESYESKAIVINSKSKPFRHNADNIKQSLSYELSLNSWPDEGDDAWDKINFFSSKNQSQVDDNCAQENFKSDWNLTFHNPDDDNKLEQSYKFANMRESTENEMRMSGISSSIMHTNKSVTKFPEMQLAQKCNDNMNHSISQDSNKYERNTITFSEPILPSRQLESEDSEIHQRKKNDTDAWLKSSTLSNVSKPGSGMLENPITMKSTDSKIGGNQNCNIHQFKKKNISCADLAQEEGTCDRTNQNISHTIPEMMDEKYNEHVRRTDYHKDIKLVQKLLKKYDTSYEAPPLKNSNHSKGSIIHRENLVCSNGLENPIDDELHRKAGCADTVIDASLDSWFYRHAALAAQVTNKKKSYGKTQLTVKLNADKISYLSQQKNHMVRISPRRKSDISGGMATTSRSHFKSPIADLSADNNQMVMSKGGMVDDQHTKIFNTTSRNPCQTVRKLSSEKIKFWETSK